MAMQLAENDPVIEGMLRDFAASLSEKDRRRFAAVEAKQRGFGGIRYIASVIGCCEKTIERGMNELDHLADDPALGRIRRPGAGRKKNRIGFRRGREPHRMLGSENGGGS